MSRGPNKVATDKSVHDRLRRLRPDTEHRKLAKTCAQEGDTLGALNALYAGGDIELDHVHAHERWLTKGLF